MSESGHHSDYSDEMDYSEESSVDTLFTNSQPFSEGDESDEQLSQSDLSQISESEPEFEVLRRRKVQLANVSKSKILHDQPQNYAPERWPPLLDFLFVFSSFVAAVVAAYFTIF